MAMPRVVLDAVLATIDSYECVAHARSIVRYSSALVSRDAQSASHVTPALPAKSRTPYRSAAHPNNLIRWMNNRLGERLNLRHADFMPPSRSHSLSCEPIAERRLGASVSRKLPDSYRQPAT
jgi:hypothetical protein